MALESSPVADSSSTATKEPPPSPSSADSLREPPPTRLEDLLRDQLVLLEQTAKEDTMLEETVRRELLEVVDHYRRSLKASDDPVCGLARWVHWLSFELFSRLGSTRRAGWALHWVMLDLQIESHLRRSGFTEEAASIYAAQRVPV
jgi:hypothetical protein